jgi:hypothetical protein
VSDPRETRWGFVEWITVTAITLALLACMRQLTRIADVAERAYPALDGGGK